MRNFEIIAHIADVADHEQLRDSLAKVRLNDMGFE
jgi:hypothetical protein